MSSLHNDIERFIHLFIDQRPFNLVQMTINRTQMLVALPLE